METYSRPDSAFVPTVRRLATQLSSCFRLSRVDGHMAVIHLARLLFTLRQGEGVSEQSASKIVSSLLSLLSESDSPSSRSVSPEQISGDYDLPLRSVTALALVCKCGHQSIVERREGMSKDEVQAIVRVMSIMDDHFDGFTWMIRE